MHSLSRGKMHLDGVRVERAAHFLGATVGMGARGAHWREVAAELKGCALDVEASGASLPMWLQFFSVHSCGSAVAVQRLAWRSRRIWCTMPTCFSSLQHSLPCRNSARLRDGRQQGRAACCGAHGASMTTCCCRSWFGRGRQWRRRARRARK